MKNIKLVLLGTFVILLSIVIATFVAYRYNQVIFMIRHISLYVLLSFVSVVGLLMLYRLLKDSIINLKINNGLVFLKGFTALIYVLILFLISTLQMGYIDLYETPLLTGCEYADDLGNLIYGTDLPYECGEPSIISETANEIVFEFSEAYAGINEVFEIDGKTVTGGSMDMNVLATVTMRYDHVLGNKVLAYQEIQWTQSTILSNALGVRYAYKSVTKVIENSYLEDEFYSNAKTYKVERLDDEPYTLFNVGHEPLTEPLFFESHVTMKASDYLGERVFNISLLDPTPSDVILQDDSEEPGDHQTSVIQMVGGTISMGKIIQQENSVQLEYNVRSMYLMGYSYFLVTHTELSTRFEVSGGNASDDEEITDYPITSIYQYNDVPGISYLKSYRNTNGELRNNINGNVYSNGEVNLLEVKGSKLFKTIQKSKYIVIEEYTDTFYSKRTDKALIEDDFIQDADRVGSLSHYGNYISQLFSASFRDHYIIYNNPLLDIR